MHWVAGPLTATNVSNRIEIFALGEGNKLLNYSWNRSWSSRQLDPAFEHTVQKLGLPYDFGDPPPAADFWRYELRTVAESFVGPLSAASWGGERMDVFGYGDSGDILQLRRSNYRSGLVWESLGNRWSELGPGESRG